MTKRTALTLALSLVAAAGCQDDLITSPVAPAAARSAAPASSAATQSRVDEEPFVEMAKETPSFAGYYIDSSGTLVVRVADMAEAGRARASMAAREARWKTHGSHGHASPRIDVRPAEYSFQQLAAWRDLVYENVLGMEGVVYDDLDEVHNRVTIALLPTASGSHAAVVAQLKTLGIPLAAVRFVTSAPFHTQSARGASRAARLDAGENIAGPYSTLAGGESVTMPNGSCAVAFIGVFQGMQVLASASHCSTVVFGLDHSQVAMPYPGGTVGSEVADPSPTSNLCNFWFIGCLQARGSDGTLYSVNPNAPTMRGAIARTQTRGSSSTVVSASHPWFYITSTATSHAVGWVVDKIGPATGWTYGAISSTCVDFRAANFGLRCVNVVDTQSADGDSGAPVFRLDDPSDPNNSSVTLMGILSGSAGSGRVVYSSYGSLNQELGGGLNPLTAALMGPVYLNGSLTSDGYTLDWNPVVATGLDTPTEYRVYSWTTFTQFDQEGYPYTYQMGDPVLLTTTPGTSFTATGASYTSTSCYAPDPYVTVDHYSVTAWNQGIATSSNEVCFQ